MTERAATRGRSLESLLGEIREQIASSFYREGGLLPSTRELAERFGVSAETVRRGLKQLEREGVLKSEPRSGFRVSSSEDSSLTRPIAYITDYQADLADAQPATWALSIAFQGSAAARGWSVLGAHGGGREWAAVVEQIRAANAWGVVLDTMEEEFCEEVLKAGLPVVMVNSWFEASAVDVVLQDNYRGGFLAAEHLVGLGARRIGWAGATSRFCHSRERFAGAHAALSMHGLRIEENSCMPADSDGALENACRLLKGKNRPEGVLAFGPSGMALLKEAAGRLKLEIGRDLQVVGWAVEECYDLHYRSFFAEGRVPPAIVWSGREMAERAMSLLAERSEGKGRRAVRACVATELRTVEEVAR